MKILILKPSSLGDVVQALPVLRLLKLHLPAAEIHWWIASELAPLLQGDADLAGIIPFDRRRWRSPFHWHEPVASVRYMRSLKFDWVIDLQGLARSGVFAWLANGGFTIGLNTGREGARGLYDVAVPRPGPQTHAVDWYLAVLDQLRVPADGKFEWLPPRPEAAAQLHAKWKPAAARWVAIQPGARWMNKRWPVEHFSELVSTLTRRHRDLRFAIVGGREDQELGAAIAGAGGGACVDLTGRTTLPELVEWVRLSDLMVTNDTGPMHVAAALGKPVVSMFGPTNPRQTGPYGQVEEALRISLPCAPCLKSTCSYAKPMECLRALLPATVLETTERQLATLPSLQPA